MANPNLLEYLPLAAGYSVVEMEAPESTHGKTLAELDLRNVHSIAVIAIRSKDGEIKVVPGGTSTVWPGDVFTLERGSSIVVDGHAIRFDEITEDSRCPANVDCVWEGNGFMKLREFIWMVFGLILKSGATLL